MNRPLNRRRVCQQLLLVLVFGIVFTASGAAKEIVIEMWDGLTGDDKPVMDSFVEDFNKAYAGQIRIARTPLVWNDFYTKLRVAVAGDVAPDIAIMHRNRLYEHALMGILRPIDNLFAAYGWKDSDWLPGVAEGGIYDGKRYGTALDIHNYLLMYNEESIATAGLPGPSLNSLQFVDYAKKLTRPASGNTPARFATGFELNATTLATVLWQWGGEYFTGPRLDQVTIDQDASRRALDYLHGLHYESQVAALPGQPQDIFKGEVAMRLTYTAAINRARREREAGGINLRVARGDVIYGSKGTGIFSNSHMFTFPVRKTDAEREKAMMTFVDYFNRNSIRWAALGHLPARREVVASPEFRQMREHMTYAQMNFRFFVGQPWGAATGILDTVMRKVLRNEAPIAAALTEAQTAMINRVAQMKKDFNIQW